MTSAHRTRQTVEQMSERGVDILGFTGRITQQQTTSQWFSWRAWTRRRWRGITLAISDAATATVQATSNNLHHWQLSHKDSIIQ